ncbi:MAG TPA: FixH family protein [Methylomirabilota bacterium]|nr:FixH family protein [Methylomirabilota bacterium]
MKLRLDLHELRSRISERWASDDGPGREPAGPELGRRPRRRSSALTAIVVLAMVLVAAAWAIYANVFSGRPAMDMSMRVSSGGTPFPVELAAVERGPMAGAVVYTGSVAPLSEEDIYPRVTGRILEMPVYPGDAVRAGQVVARLDDVELSSRVREAEAAEATARAGRVQMEKELAMAEAEAAYARSVFSRTERLLAVGAVSRQDFENDRAMALAAEAKRDAARAKLEAGASMLAQSEAMQRTARIVRDYVNIQAPSAGYVAKRLVAPGVLVQPGMAILKIARIDKVRLQANVGERDLPLMKVGSPVTVTTTGGEPFTARVTSVFPFVDQGGRTAVVEAIVDNPERRLLPGQYVTMQFVTGDRPEALSVPRGAVVRMAGKAAVWVAAGERAERRDVTTGLEGAERVEIVSGLRAGEQVIARGHEGLYGGARVSDMAAPTSAREPAADPHKGMSGMRGTTDAMPVQNRDDRMAQSPAATPSQLKISLATVPPSPRVGETRLRIEVKDAAGAPVRDAKVEVTAGMAGMPGPDAIARPGKEPGTYEATVNLGMAGAWTVEVSATRPGGGKTTAKFKLEAK